ncbi:MAG: hypothetical protein HY869_20375 [Chloroflexi bacterium]|nr:hypothetical protein [Chloroflexota bacterium]
MDEFLIDRSVVDAIGRTVVLAYAAVLALELLACLFFVRRNTKILLRTAIVVLGLALLGVYLQTPDLCGLWFGLALTVTGVFANTKIGFASKSLRLRSRLKIDPVLQNLLVWLVLFGLSYTLWVGSSVALAVTRDPRTIHSQVWNISKGQSGNITLFFQESGWSFDTQVPEEYEALFSEGDCLALTYYEFPPAGIRSLWHVSKICDPNSPGGCV